MTQLSTPAATLPTTATSTLSWHSWLILYWPHRVQRHLDQLARVGVVDRAPNLWQIELGVLRMWHRLLFRSETVGCCEDHAVRQTLRAKLLQFRPLRFPFLLWERAIAPLDMSGLCQPTWRMIRHLLGAHHEARQFAYDLEILRGTPGALEELQRRTRAIISGADPRAEWLRDLCVFERYHHDLLAAVDRVLASQPLVEAEERDDPDITFSAYVRWCSAQPEDPRSTLRAWRNGSFPQPVLPSATAAVRATS